MFGIPGLDPIGAVHAGLGLLAVALGAPVVLMKKGTSAHRRLGLSYVATMVALNATAFLVVGGGRRT